MNKYLLLCLMMVSSAVPAGDVIYLGAMKEDLNQSFVAEAGIIVDEKERVIKQISLTLFGHEDEVYEGVNGSLSLSFGSDIKFYTGVGAFIGEYQICEYDEDLRDEVCEDDYTGGLYPEIGLMLSVHKFRIGTYGRYYKTFDAGNNEYKMFGVKIGYEM